MPSAPTCMTVISQLWSHDPGNAALQRLYYTAADDKPDDQRAGLLFKLARSKHANTESLRALAGDRDPEVRADVWTWGNWNAEELTAMVASEPAVQVRRAALSHRGLAPDTYVAAAVPVTSQEDARAVLADHGHLPDDLIEIALRVYLQIADPQVLNDQDAKELCDLFAARPTVAHRVIVDPTAPFWAAFAAACVCPEIDDAAVSELLTGFLNAGVSCHADDDVSSHLHAQRLTAQLVERMHVSDETIEAAWGLTSDHLAFMSALSQERFRRQKPAHLRGLDKVSDRTGSDDLAARWSSCTDDERSSAVALHVLGDSACTKALFDEVTAYLEFSGDDSADWSLEALTRDGAPKPWLAHFPDLALVAARRTPVTRLEWFCRVLSSDGVAFDRIVVEDILANPGQWRRRSLLELQHVWQHDEELVARVPVAALLRQDSWRGPAGAHVTEQLERLAVDDPGTRRMLLRAVEASMAVAAPLQAVVEAAKATLA